ncbi:fibroblast growth factor branchless [Rhynchophorus ferrugineus]|uniref:Fibroblast growth factor n=1 Tax=Rhynchophorus ferrugineus TaxID=354439 RepID=A0A834M0C1_RHYFE|nr:hypothetical protein GWI33_019612 [Rhynchophorus ferrugineus]
MVKTLFLGLLLAAVYVGSVSAAPCPRGPDPPPDNPEEDPAARSERSANLSHVTGAARQVQMFIKNRHLQILPDGTVNGTTDEISNYTIMQRTTIGIGQLRIQGVFTCQYLCMDECGLLYGSIEFRDECIFNETMEQTNYNKYWSNKYSNERRTYYLALNRRGQPRKVMVKARQQLGKLDSYTRVLTRPVMHDHPIRHHNHHQCPQGAQHHQQPTDPPRCRKKKKKKKKKRKFNEKTNDFEPKRHNSAGNLCETVVSNNGTADAINATRDNIECQRDKTVTDKPKAKNGSVKVVGDKKNKNKKKKKNNKNKQRKRLDQVDVTQESTTTTMSPMTSTTSPDDVSFEEDYTVETSTHLEWEESTGLPDISMAVEKQFNEHENAQSNSD